MRKNCLPVKETRNNLRLDPYMGWTASTPVWPNSFGPCAGQTADVFAIYLFKFYFSNCTCSFVGNLMKFKLNSKQCDELMLGEDDDMITVVRKWGICSRVNFVHNQVFYTTSTSVRIVHNVRGISGGTLRMWVIEVLAENQMFDSFTFPIKKDALCLLKIVINLYEQKWGRSIYQITYVTTTCWSNYWLGSVGDLIKWEQFGFPNATVELHHVMWINDW